MTNRRVKYKGSLGYLIDDCDSEEASVLPSMFNAMTGYCRCQFGRADLDHLTPCRQLVLSQ